METKAAMIGTRSNAIGNLKESEPDSDCIVARLRRISKVLDESKVALGNTLAVVRGMAPADPAKAEPNKLTMMEFLSGLHADASEVSEMAQELRDKIGG